MIGTDGGTQGDDDRMTRLTIFPLIYPYIEQAAIYSEYQYTSFDGRTGFNVRYGNAWWNYADAATAGTLDDEGRKRHSSVSTLRCPSRRGGGAVMANSGLTGNTEMTSGPQGDYGIVITFIPTLPASSGTTTWYWKIGSNNTVGASAGHLVSSDLSPFRPALLTAGDGNTWQPRDSMSWWQDGTSNQILFGEKHIPVTLVGLCSAEGAAPGEPEGDCSYLNFGERKVRSVSRIFMQEGTGMAAAPTFTYITLAKGPDQPITTGTTMRTDQFGSFHPGIVNFLLGDGAVKAITVTTPNSATYPFLFSLGRVDSGAVVSLP